jgi:hypothetical protein
LYLINVHNGIPDKKIPPIDINKYPTIKEHLDQFWRRLKNREDRGITPYNLRSCAYMDDFSKQKITWAETMRIHKSDIKNFPRFGFTEKDFFTDKTCFFAIGKNLFFLLAYLNSSIGRYLCKRYVSILDNGGYLMQKAYLELIPIAMPNSDKIREIEIISKKIISCHEKSIELELEVNKILYSLFAFSQKEINYIKNDTWETLSR